MNLQSGTDAGLEECKVSVRLKLSSLWTSVVFLYIYADYFGLYVPGALKSMLEGQMRPLGATTQGILLGASLMLAIPSLMIFLSVTLRADWAKMLNLVCGVVYSLTILITMWGWAFYVLYGVIEITLTALVVWHAWRWPKAKAAA